MKIKLLIVALLAIGFFSCNRKTTDGWIPLTKKELKQHKGLLDSILVYNTLVDSLNNRQITIDTSSFSFGTHSILNTWTPKLDTSDVIIMHIKDWELPIISFTTGKIVYPTSPYGTWIDVYGKSPDSKFFKVKDGVWIPVEWPKDIVDIHIRSKDK